MDGDPGDRVSQLAVDEKFKVSCAKELALLALIEKTGYDMVQENGQRKYGGPPPGTGGASTQETHQREPDRLACSV